MSGQGGTPLSLAEAYDVAHAACQPGERLLNVHRSGDLWYARYGEAFVSGDPKVVIPTRTDSIGLVKRPRG